MGFCRLLQIALSLVLVFVVTLYPYAFSFPSSLSEFLNYSLLLGWGRSHELDVVVNTLLFLPLGFSLTSALVAATRSAGIKIFVSVCFIILGLSYVLELLQLFLPHRFPSSVDVLANGSGGGIGFLCFHLRKKRNVRLNLFLYLIAAFLGAALLQRSTGLRNWDPTFPLLVGNEKTGTRPWEGDIRQLYIADKAISAIEVKQVVQHSTQVSSLLADSLLASYRFTADKKSIHDELGLLPDLRWQGKLSTLVATGDTFLGAHRWLETDGSASSLINRVQKSSQFTLGIVVRTHDPTQGGPARVVSLSGDLHLRNFTLGQQETDLVFRLRTPVTAASHGAKATFMFPRVFTHENLQNLILTYDGARLVLYVDGLPHPTTFEISPGAAIFSLFIDSPLLGSQFCKLIYYASICIPLGIFVMLTIDVVSGQIVKRSLAMSVCIFFSAILLESLLVASSGKSWNAESVFISIAMTFATIVLWVGYRMLWKRWSVTI